MDKLGADAGGTMGTPLQVRVGPWVCLQERRETFTSQLGLLLAIYDTVANPLAWGHPQPLEYSVPWQAVRCGGKNVGFGV